jgi:hypothetical protein
MIVDGLKEQIRRSLVQLVSPAFRQALDDLRTHGCTREQVIKLVQQLCEMDGKGRRCNVVLAVAAYLETKSTDGWEAIIP